MNEQKEEADKGNVTRKELSISINERLGISQRNAAKMVDTIFAAMKDTLVNGESLKLVQFGTLTVRGKSPRRGRNPRTGESMTITKRKMVTFRPSKRLRELLNEDEN
ncbi:integration host factor subunit alpha [Candidatus Electronema sp. JM]|uniref:integration host factor subunit alpha n=1 Tax=Candidatus Electronema sp. JM TaxID=3401571 RepID=UPI003AA86BA6